MTLLSVEDAFEKVNDVITVLSSEKISVADALGRVTSEDIFARLTQPPFDVSSMDGYAVRSEDAERLGYQLTQIGVSQAGQGFDGEVKSGECVRIFTGAPMPFGCDCVIMQEDTEKTKDDKIAFNEIGFKGKYVRPKGLDFNEGDCLIKKGTLLTARHIGLLCAMNIPWLDVYRRPRIAVLATGDELVMPGEAVSNDQIISSNSLMLCAMIRALGGIALNLGIARDNENSLELMLNGAKGADLLITSGGISVGEYDLVRKVMGNNGLDIDVYRIAMKPGKPFMFGRLNGIPVMGLPGNPVSSYVTAFLFLRAALKKMSGRSFIMDQPIKAHLKGTLKENGVRKEYARCVFSVDENETLHAIPYEKQDSSMLVNLSKCEGFIIRYPHEDAKKDHDLVDVIRLDDGYLSI